MFVAPQSLQTRNVKTGGRACIRMCNGGILAYHTTGPRTSPKLSLCANMRSKVHSCTAHLPSSPRFKAGFPAKIWRLSEQMLHIMGEMSCAKRCETGRATFLYASVFFCFGVLAPICLRQSVWGQGAGGASQGPCQRLSLSQSSWCGAKPSKILRLSMLSIFSMCVCVTYRCAVL